MPKKVGNMPTNRIPSQYSIRIANTLPDHSTVVNVRATTRRAANAINLNTGRGTIYQYTGGAGANRSGLSRAGRAGPGRVG